MANTIYTVDLYEKRKLRSSSQISWNQPEINVSTVKSVWFPSNAQEYDAYLFQDISHIFSVKVHE